MFSPQEEKFTGPDAIRNALSKLDLDKLEKQAREDLASGKRTKKGAAIKMLNVISGLRRNNLQPSDLTISKVPVIPPIFRPFSISGDTFLPGDANELYKDLINYNNTYKELREEVGEEGSADAAYQLYQAAKSVYGYADPVNPKTKQRGVSGFLQHLIGKGAGPKFSMFQRRLFSKNMDSVGRGVITANPELDMDEVGVPEEIAWKLYGPYIQRKLVQSGMSSMRALENVTNRSDMAKKALDREMGERPVVYSRAPAWHKYNVIAGWPKLVKGDNIEINSYTTGGLSADFDGDEVLNYVVFSVPREKIKDFSKYMLTEVADPGMLSAMFNKLKLPVTKNDNEGIFIADLEDFPRLELTNTKEGEKGPIDFFSVPEGTKVVAFDEATGAPVWAEVAFFSKHYDRLVETVTLACGKQTHTDDDPRAVYGMDPASPTMELGRFTPTEALAKGVVVPFVRDMHQIFTDAGVITEVRISDETTMPLTWDTGYMLGALAGDGWWDKKDYREKVYHRKIYISDLKGHNASKVIEVMTSIFPNVNSYSKAYFKDDHADRYGDTVKYTIQFVGSSPFTEFLTECLGGEGDERTTGSANKHLPNFMLQAPLEFRKGLLCGIMDTDGSISVSHGKGRPQLMCNMGSTSHRLVRDVQLLAQTMGIQASISFSKMTTAGNAAWTLNISSVDSKRLNIFANLQCPWKKENFINTHVSDEGSTATYNKVVMPRVVVSELMKNIPAYKQRKEDVGSTCPEYLRKKNINNMWMTLNNSLKSGDISRKMANRAVSLARELRNTELSTFNGLKLHLSKRDETTPFTQEESNAIRGAINAAYPIYGDKAVYTAARGLLTTLNQPLKRGILSNRIAGNVLSFMENNPPVNYGGIDSPIVQKWISLYLSQTHISWSPVVGVDKSGQPETGYDLTVPGFETFMSADGVILSNTMNVHLPSFPESVEEAKEKLMPSKMVYSIKQEDTIVPALKHEQILGLYTAATRPAKNHHRFATEAEALQGISSGIVKLSDEIEIGPPQQTIQPTV